MPAVSCAPSPTSLRTAALLNRTLTPPAMAFPDLGSGVVLLGLPGVGLPFSSVPDSSRFTGLLVMDALRLAAAVSTSVFISEEASCVSFPAAFTVLPLPVTALTVSWLVIRASASPAEIEAGATDSPPVTIRWVALSTAVRAMSPFFPSPSCLVRVTLVPSPSRASIAFLVFR